MQLSVSYSVCVCGGPPTVAHSAPAALVYLLHRECATRAAASGPSPVQSRGPECSSPHVSCSRLLPSLLYIIPQGGCPDLNCPQRHQGSLSVLPASLFSTALTSTKHALHFTSFTVCLLYGHSFWKAGILVCSAHCSIPSISYCAQHVAGT